MVEIQIIPKIDIIAPFHASRPYHVDVAGSGIRFQIAADQQNLSLVIAMGRVIKALCLQRREQRLHI